MPCYPKQLWIRGGGKSGIHLAEVSVFARMTGKNRHFRDLSQQVLSGVVASLNSRLAKSRWTCSCVQQQFVTPSPFNYLGWVIASLSNGDGDGSENVFKKTMSFVSKTRTLHVQHAFLVHFVAVTARLQHFTLYVGRKQATTKFSFFNRTWIWFWGIQLQMSSPTSE